MTSNDTFSSCAPISAFDAGVKIGGSSSVASTRPAGSSIPHTAPVAR
jgi:hypothetical protein